MAKHRPFIEAQNKADPADETKHGFHISGTGAFTRTQANGQHPSSTVHARPRTPYELIDDNEAQLVRMEKKLRSRVGAEHQILFRQIAIKTAFIAKLKEEVRLHGMVGREVG